MERKKLPTTGLGNFSAPFLRAVIFYTKIDAEFSLYTAHRIPPVGLEQKPQVSAKRPTGGIRARLAFGSARF